jgi:hypothetical protein
MPSALIGIDWNPNDVEWDTFISIHIGCGAVKFHDGGPDHQYAILLT